MSLDICFYFQVHQPWRLRRYPFREVGHSHDYFDAAVNAEILRRVAQKCYLPMNALLAELIERYRPHFRVAFSITATALEQMAAFAPEVLTSYRRLLATGQVELLAETSHHSLAALYSPREFAAQVRHHRAVCRRLLGATGRVFRNTELITSDAVAAQVAALGYGGLCIEGADKLFGWRSVTTPYRFAAAPSLVALPRHYRLSDDIAFRFSDRRWTAWPLSVERYADWLQGEAEALPPEAHGRGFLGLFMDYETFGEHQWADTGIFDFMRALPGELLKRRGFRFIKPSEALAHVPADAAGLSMPTPFSWADQERDISAWDGNAIQRAALTEAFALEPFVRRHHARHAADAVATLEDWRRLLTSDHAYYMSTKHWADGDVHQYFSPFESPYDACINYMNVLADLAARVGAPAPRPL
ncbi:glycoside hydrolase family 57 protein [Dyella sp. A6]|uniref:glycoside hydrolase family 57 protein n=1 Tax=Dyella aluminiiresistens TaxID=3069105 RepID=UPI002E76AF5F|nr:glycoside hydrolase family 57 protein [Dyella sp. A6]